MVAFAVNDNGCGGNVVFDDWDACGDAIVVGNPVMERKWLKIKKNVWHKHGLI